MDDDSKIPKIVFKKLLMNFLEQTTLFQSELQQLQCEPKKIEEQIIVQVSNLSLSNKIKIKLKQQLLRFHQGLMSAPEIWIDLLEKDGIQSETETIIINRPSTLSKIYYQIINQIRNNLSKKQVKHQKYQYQALENNYIQQTQLSNQQKSQIKQFTFQQIFIDETSLSLIAEILSNFAKIISLLFKQGKQIITNQVQKINQQIKKCSIMNTYVLFAMLKQMNKITYQKILSMLNKKFPERNQQKKNQFCRYIQKNYEFIDLHYSVTQQTKILTIKQLELYAQQQNQKWLAYLKGCQEIAEVKLKRIFSQQGNQGVLLLKKTAPKQSTNKDQSQHKLASQPSLEPKYMPELIFRIQKGNQIRVTNARACQQSWKIFDTQDSMSELYQMMKKQIQISGKDKDHDYYSYGVPTCEYATIGGSLGKCLADINQYQNANQFLLDLSKTTAIFSTISYAMAEIPILSYFIVAGGFTYSFYIACSNQATSAYKKMNEIGIATMNAVGSVGSTLGGILLGQIIIPVPFLGAFVGGVVGGFFGTKGVRQINRFLYKSNFRDIISYLKAKIINKRYWKCTVYLLERIGIDKKYFQSHAPSTQEGKDTYITAICFCIITFYESKKYIERNEQKMLEYKKSKQIIKYEEEQTFVNEFNIVDIADFLILQKFIIVEELQNLQNFIIHLSS